MSVTAEARVPGLNDDPSTEARQETHSQGDTESAQSLNDTQTEVPVKRKRGRPRKRSIEKPNDDGSPVVKRPRGRPKGSKNKHPKPKPIPTGPKRPRGRPRKWPPRDSSAPKRGRGRPRKHPVESENLPTMVQVPGTSLSASSPSTAVSSPVIAGPVPPDDLFASDETDSLPGSLGDLIHLTTNQFSSNNHPLN